ncbi:MAG: hypothetical protein NZM38_10040 [Cytophagales bacterium]|nr:hypothetical protein [Cytophagales bacterium]MDW8385095.1 hypothetical protein [Flammeovirgaceae bacterium]
MSTKLKFLIALNVILLAVVLGIGFYSNSSQTYRNSELPFVALDTTLMPDKFVVNQYSIQQKEGVWYMNDTLRIQPEAVMSLWGMLRKLNLQREIDWILYPERIIRVEVWQNGNLQKLYNFASSEDNTETYLNLNHKWYSVYVIGSSGNIYEFLSYVEPSQWRIRRLLFSSWQKLNKLEVQYIGDPNNSYRIHKKGEFFEIPHINRLDTAKLIEYLTEVEKLNASRYWKDNRLLDSLKRQKPICVFFLEENTENSKNIQKIYYYLHQEKLVGINQWDELVSFQPKALKKVLVSRSYFEKK